MPEPIAPTSATVRPGAISRSTSRSAGWAPPSKVRLTSRSDTRPGPSGSAGASGGLTIRGARSSTWKMRAPDAVARWAALNMYPSVRIGEISISR